jgi:hypothetical protein
VACFRPIAGGRFITPSAGNGTLRLLSGHIHHLSRHLFDRHYRKHIKTSVRNRSKTNGNVIIKLVRQRLTENITEEGAEDL